MPLSLFEARQQFLLRADRGTQSLIFRLEFPRHVVQLRDAGGGQLPAIQILGQPHALYEPHIARSKAKEGGILTQFLFCCGGHIKCHQLLPEHLCVSVLAPEEALHEMQHRDVDKHGGVIGAGKEQSVGQEVESLADGGDGHLVCAARMDVPDEEQNPSREQSENEEG